MAARQIYIHDTLPRYSCISTLPDVPSGSETARSKISHQFSSTSAGLQLTLTSSAKYPTQRPVYFKGDSIEGIVHVTAEKGDSIQGLSIAVIGRIMVGMNGSQFFKTGRTLWHRTHQTANHVEKLRGNFNFPFSLDLPLVAEHEDQRLPHTFIERDLRISVEYELTVTLEKGRMRMDSTIKTPLVYISLSSPPPFSQLRQLAYQSRSAPGLVGPVEDPDGWVSLPPILISVGPSLSILAKSAQYICQISLAAPLSYTRGSILPLFVAFSPDMKALSNDTLIAFDAISAPSIVSHSIVLRRRLRYVGRRGAIKEQVVDIQSPVVWSMDISRGKTLVEDSYDEKRTLQGEVALPADLVPSVRFDTFCISYELVLTELIVPNFVCALFGRPLGKESNSSWAVQEVEIVSSFGQGPRPVSYAPQAGPVPLSHKSEKKPQLPMFTYPIDDQRSGFIPLVTDNNAHGV